MPLTRSRTEVSPSELDANRGKGPLNFHGQLCAVCRRRITRAQVCSLCRIARALEPDT